MKKSITKSALDILNAIYKASPGAAVALTRNRIPLPPGLRYPDNLVEQSKGYTPGDPQPMVTPLRLINAILADAGGGRISLPCGPGERTNKTPGFVVAEAGPKPPQPKWGTVVWWTVGHTAARSAKDPGSCQIGYRTVNHVCAHTTFDVPFRTDVASHLVAVHNADFFRVPLQPLQTGNAELDGIWFVSQVLRDEGDLLYCVTSKNKQILIGPIADAELVVHLVNLHNSVLVVGTELQAEENRKLKEQVANITRCCDNQCSSMEENQRHIAMLTEKIRTAHFNIEEAQRCNKSQYDVIQQLQFDKREQGNRINALVSQLDTEKDKNENQMATIQSYMDEKDKTREALAELEKAISKLAGRS